MTRTNRKRGYAFFAIAAVAVGAWWIASDEATRAAIANAVGGKPALTAAKAKPICASPVNPNLAAPTDCIPQYLANLPPDPGEAGKATIDGIDADKDGVRDDVQNFIAREWGHSPVAVKGLTIVAQQYLRAVHYGDSLGKEETRKRFAAETMRESSCAFFLETQETREGGARKKVKEQVLNTDERRRRAVDFDLMFAHSLMDLPDGTPSEICGFDPDALAAAEGQLTVASKIRAETIERTKREEEQEEKK